MWLKPNSTTTYQKPSALADGNKKEEELVLLPPIKRGKLFTLVNGFGERISLNMCHLAT